MSQVNWNGASAWVMNSANGAVLNLFDNGGVQAKLESLSTGGVNINAPITFAATAGAPWGEINAVSSSMTFGSGGTLTVNGSAVAGIRMFGGSGAISTTFNNTVNATGKYFATSAVGQTVNIGGSFTATNFYLMNTGTLNLNAGGNLNGTAVRLGGDFATTGTQNLTLGATFNLTPLTGGLTFAGVVNSVMSNTSGLLTVNSQNTSGTNTLSNQVALDSALKITQSAGGTLAITQVKGGDNTTGTDIKGNTLTFTPAAAGTINHSGTIYNSAGTGAITLNGAGKLVLSGANSFTGATLVTSGTLEAGATDALKTTSGVTVNTGGTLLLSGSDNRIGNSVPLTLAGGTFNTGGLSETLGTLTLSANSVIDFGNATSTLTFADSSGTTWAGSFRLSIFNWSGNTLTGGGTDQLRFLNNGLTPAQLARIDFYSGSTPETKLSITPSFFANGFVGGAGEVTPVPEPSSVATVMGILGLVGWRERRKMLRERVADRRMIGA